MPITEQLQHAQSLHQHGQLNDALAAYLALTASHPREVAPWQLAALVYVQLHQENNALALLQQALSHLPKEASLHNSLGNVLARLNHTEAAIEAYQAALNYHAEYPGALNNLGNCLFHQGHLEQAKKAYLSALDIDPDYPDAHFNLARIYLSEENLTAARSECEKTLAIAPEHAAALGQLAQIYLEEKSPEQALRLAEKRVELQAKNASAWHLLGQIYYQLHALLEANNALKTAYELDPQLPDLELDLAHSYYQMGQHDLALKHYLRQTDHRDAAYNIGVILSNQQRLNDAIPYFETALAKDPQHIASHLNLAAVYLKLNKRDAAINHYQAALTLDPNNAQIKHILSALTQSDNPEAPPRAYAEELFDQYAQAYDQHLTQYLSYKAHQSLFDRWASAHYPEKNSLIIIDLGCGTGLAGALFSPYAKELIGIDISSGMLQQAKDKHIYTRLIHQDLLNGLSALNQEKSLEADLIIAADVLPYLGDLSALFSQVAQSLKTGGSFGFTSEIGTHPNSSDFYLQPNIRYTHNPAYIKRLAQEYGFVIHDQARVMLRTQFKEPVEGQLYILTKT